MAGIVGGACLGSMALGADGWRLSTRAPVLGIAALAYHLARRHADDRRFGIGRFGDLAPSPAPC
ncbi:hypothetical protein ACXR8U_23810 [Methylobacterium radiotolerans]